MTKSGGAFRVGMAGAGNASVHHLRGWQQVPDFPVVAIADPDTEKAKRRAAEFGVPAVAGSVAEMLRTHAIDVLDVVTPPSTHVDLVAQTLPRGIHVLCQKPLASTTQDIRRIARLEAAGPGRLMVHENWRFRSWYRVLKPRLDAAAFGRLFHVRSATRFAGTVRTPTHADVPFSVARQPFFATLPRFIVLESMIHQLDALRFLLGEPTSLFARIHHVSEAVQGEDAAVVVLGYPDLTAVVERSYASKGYPDPPVMSESLVIEGTDGSAFLSPDGRLRLVHIDATKDDETVINPSESDPYEASYRDAIAHFATRLRTGDAFETSLADNMNTLQLVFAAYESARTGAALDEAALRRVLHSEGVRS